MKPTRLRGRLANLSRRRSEEGATATEYALLMTFIALVLFLGIVAFGGSLNGLYDQLGTTIDVTLTP